MTASLSAKTRKIVPSATPAASAIWRVVTLVPWVARSGTVAATIAARRSPAGGAAARERGASVSGSGSARAVAGGDVIAAS